MSPNIYVNVFKSFSSCICSLALNNYFLKGYAVYCIWIMPFSHNYPSTLLGFFFFLRAHYYQLYQENRNRQIFFRRISCLSEIKRSDLHFVKIWLHHFRVVCLAPVVLKSFLLFKWILDCCMPASQMGFCSFQRSLCTLADACGVVHSISKEDMSVRPHDPLSEDVRETKHNLYVPS